MSQITGILPDSDSGRVAILAVEQHVVVDETLFNQTLDPALGRPAMTTQSRCDACGTSMVPSGTIWSCPGCGDENRRRNN